MLSLVAMSPLAAQPLGELSLDTLDTPARAEEMLRDERVVSRTPPEPLDTTAPASTEREAPEPFGARLFDGGFADDREDGLNPEYRVQPGDRVSVRVWGAIELDQVLTVDARGNIFLPKVGPVPVGNVRNAELNARVRQQVRTVFTDNVRVYTSLLGAQPVAVFVTGHVRRPGRFGGIPSNSALHFLDRAGGIDARRGSYRDVLVLRDGQTLARLDLYDFLSDGSQPDIQFRDGDTLVVGPRGGTVAVTGDAAVSARFELSGASLLGADLMRRAQIDTSVSHAGVSGLRDGRPFSVYLPLRTLATWELRDGDRVHFRSDRHELQIVVEVEGAHLGPSRFVVPRDTRLGEFLDHVEVDPALADTRAVSLRRRSIAERQQQALDESLRRLEARYLTASSATDAEARIRSQEAQLIGNFVTRARQVRPDGRLVVASREGVADVLLEPGDIVSIPRRSDSVLLSGEIMVAQAMLWSRGQRARDYIGDAGGFTERAATDRIVVIHPDGRVLTGRNPPIRAGSEIIVLPKVTSKNLQLASTIVDILYKIAIATSVALSL